MRARGESRLAGLACNRFWDVLGERDESTVISGGQDEVREEAGHYDPLLELAQPRLRVLAVRERDRQLGIAAAGSKRKREGTAEARVHVGDLVAALLLPEALDVGGALEPERLGHMGAVLDQVPVLDRHPLDRLAAPRLDHRPRDRVQAAPVEVAEDVDRELLALAALLDERLRLRVAEEEVELLTVLGAVDVLGAETLASLDEDRKCELVRQLVRQPARRRRDPVRLEELVREVLVVDALHDLGPWQQRLGAELTRVARAGEEHLVEVGEGHDEADVVRCDDLGELRQVARILDPREEGVVVGVVQRRSERAEVGGDRRRARASKRADDVDAPARAGEEGGRHAKPEDSVRPWTDRRSTSAPGPTRPRAGSTSTARGTPGSRSGRAFGAWPRRWACCPTGLRTRSGRRTSSSTTCASRCPFRTGSRPQSTVRTCSSTCTSTRPNGCSRSASACSGRAESCGWSSPTSAQSSTSTSASARSRTPSRRRPSSAGPIG